MAKWSAALAGTALASFSIAATAHAGEVAAFAEVQGRWKVLSRNADSLTGWVELHPGTIATQRLGSFKVLQSATDAGLTRVQAPKRAADLCGQRPVSFVQLVRLEEEKKQILTIRFLAGDHPDTSDSGYDTCAEVAYRR